MISEPNRLDRELQLLGCAKCDLLACLDLDRFAGGRIPAHSSWPLPDLKDTKTSNPNAFALLEVLGNEADQAVQQVHPLPFRQLMVLCQSSREMLEGDRTIGRFCLSCHSLEPFIERQSED